MSSQFKYAVVGAGAVGSYYGAKLAHGGGHDVHFLMRSDLGAVKLGGLTVRSKDGDFHIAKVNAYGSAAEIGPCDVVLIALKTTANDVLAQVIPPLLHKETMLLTLQNGLGNEEWLAKNFGAERVLGGLCFVCLNRVAPGVIEHFGHGTLSIGEFHGPPQTRTARIVQDFRDSGIDARAVQNLITERWRKLVWNIPFNGLGIAAHANTEEVLRDENLHALAINLMRETITAADKLGHNIPASFADEQIERSWPMGPYRSSSQIDFEMGREVEVESIWGEPLRQATRANTDVPRLEMLYALIKKLATKS